jgi:hypothetical protein
MSSIETILAILGGMLGISILIGTLYYIATIDFELYGKFWNRSSFRRENKKRRN